MGIQSTRTITREEAEHLYVHNYVDNHLQRLQRESRMLTDEELEEELESTYENFNITDGTT